MYDILVSLGILEDIAAAADYYASNNQLSQEDQNIMICCVVKKYAPGQYTQLEQQYPTVVANCSPNDNCEAILSPAGL